MHGNWCVFYLLIHCIIGGYFVYLCRTDVSLCSLYCFSYYLPSTNFINEKREKRRLHFSRFAKTTYCSG
ncbi:hypothetical protein CS549_05590 [Porphyromonas gingivalis]|nr:hypothetical protein CS549_05590 [Porphyromonas gingivalis]PDP63797.1 hypothetical protein CLI80_07975 [Porphyromonas gingivalis]PDP78873.1 hypothetical protein CLI73_06985 [Porphyromonas gingivalis]